MKRLTLAVLLVLLAAAPAAAIPMCGPGSGWLATCTAGITIYDVRTEDIRVEMDAFTNDARVLVSGLLTGTAVVTLGDPSLLPGYESPSIPFQITMDLASADGLIRLELSTHPLGIIVEESPTIGRINSTRTDLRFTLPDIGVLTGEQMLEAGFDRLPFTSLLLNPAALLFDSTGTFVAVTTGGLADLMLTNPRDPVVTAQVSEPSTALLLTTALGLAGVVAWRRWR